MFDIMFDCFKKANQSLKGNWLKAAGITFCFLLFDILVYLGLILLFGVPIGSSLQSAGDYDLPKIILSVIFYIAFAFIYLPVFWSYVTMFLGKVRGGEMSLSLLTNGYSDISRIVGGYVLIGLCSMACMFAFDLLLFLSLGFVFSYLWISLMLVLLSYVLMIYIGLSFSQYLYVLFDDEEISIIDAMKRSIQLMKGHKLQLFFMVLILVILVVLLSIVTLGIGIFFLLPYMFTAYAHFYEYVSEAEPIE